MSQNENGYETAYPEENTGYNHDQDEEDQDKEEKEKDNTEAVQ
jgi:hypothetical protein